MSLPPALSSLQMSDDNHQAELCLRCRRAVAGAQKEAMPGDEGNCLFGWE